MSKQCRPSGALKRKLKKEREVNLKKTNKVLDTYFTTSAKPEKSQDDCDLSGKSIIYL